MDRCFLGLFQKYSDKHFETFRRIHDYGNSWGILDLHFRVDQKKVQSRKWSNSTCESHVSQHWILNNPKISRFQSTLPHQDFIGFSLSQKIEYFSVKTIYSPKWHWDWDEKAYVAAASAQDWTIIALSRHRQDAFLETLTINNLLLIWVDPSSILLKATLQETNIAIGNPPFWW